MHRGLWFFPTSIQSTLAGKSITQIRIKIERKSNDGESSAQPIHFWTHNYSSKPSGTPTLSNDAGTLASFAWGEEKWVNLPLSYATALQNGTAKGIAIYEPDAVEDNGALYAKFYKDAVLEITYR